MFHPFIEGQQGRVLTFREPDEEGVIYLIVALAAWQKIEKR